MPHANVCATGEAAAWISLRSRPEENLTNQNAAAILGLITGGRSSTLEVECPVSVRYVQDIHTGRLHKEAIHNGLSVKHGLRSSVQMQKSPAIVNPVFANTHPLKSERLLSSVHRSGLVTTQRCCPRRCLCKCPARLAWLGATVVVVFDVEVDCGLE